MWDILKYDKIHCSINGVYSGSTEGLKDGDIDGLLYGISQEPEYEIYLNLWLDFQLNIILDRLDK